MEPSVPITTPASSANNTNRTLKIITGIMSVIAVCGVGFGIYGVSKSGAKDEQISDIIVQSKDDNNASTAAGQEKIDDTHEEEATTTVADSPIIALSDRYLYIAEMGIKINLGDELKNVSVLIRHSDGQTTIWGARGDDARLQAAANMDFAIPMANTVGIGHIVKYKEGSGDILENWTKVFEYDNYDVYYWHSSETTDIPSSDTNQYISDRDAAFEIIDSVFMNSQNYSKI